MIGWLSGMITEMIYAMMLDWWMNIHGMRGDSCGIHPDGALDVAPSKSPGLTTLVMLFSEPVSSGGPKFLYSMFIYFPHLWLVFGAIPPMEILWNRQNILRISLSQRSFSHFQTLLVILDDASEMLSTDQGRCWLTFKTSMAMAIPSLVEMYRNVTAIHLAFKTVHFLMACRLAGCQKSSSQLCLAA